ncbi:MAG: hypothetical protein JWM32_1799 [Verrucomicrobia bacterium]|nr:hypothetical protein [Verrucomicrobiota bacterium]
MNARSPRIRKGRPLRFRAGIDRLLLLAAGIGSALTLSLELQADQTQEQTIVMMADLTKAGRNYVHPDRERPMYYRPVFFQYEEKGPPLGSWERKPDNESELRIKLALMLASQGYLPANARHPPSLVISFEWGTIAPIILELNSDPDIDHGFVANADELRGIILGARAAEVNMSSNAFGVYTNDMKTLRPRHYLVISAFRSQPGPHKNEILLWSVHTTSNVWNNYLKEMMPEFISAAAAGVGRSVMPAPVFKTLVPHVSIGEATVKAPPNDPSK